MTEEKRQQRIYEDDIAFLEALQSAKGLKTFADAIRYVLQQTFDDSLRGEVVLIAQAKERVQQESSRRIDELLADEEGKVGVAA